jgi:ABC-type branched-subunit amino acid transport system substrate-binding protein
MIKSAYAWRWVGVVAVIAALSACNSGKPTGSAASGSGGTAATGAKAAGATLEIGIPTLGNASYMYSLFGISGSSPPSNQQIEAGYQAVVNYVNEHGGLDGHTIKAIYAQIDSSLSTSIKDQEECTTFTQDNHVFAALDSRPDQFVLDCLQHANAVEMAGGIATGDAFNADNTSYAQDPLFATTGSLSLTSVASVLVNGLYKQGFFTPGAQYSTGKIGLVVDNTPAFTRSVDKVLKPALAHHGLKLTDEQLVQPTYSISDVAPVEKEVSSAVLRFRSEGIDHVMFMDLGDLGFPWQAAAQAQDYYPRLGFTSTLGEAIRANATTYKRSGKSQDEMWGNSIGVGWYPAADVANYPPNASGQLCNQIEAQSGVNTAAVALIGFSYWTTCDQLFLLADAMKSSGHVTPASTVSGLARVTDFTPSGFLGPADFTNGRRDGAAEGRYVVYELSCHCFQYTSQNVPLSSLESS